MSEDIMRVKRIRNGIVIDHIPPGNALNVLRILGIDGSEDYIVSIAMNISSGRMGKKDIVKVEARVLKEKEINKIALVAPEATYNIIKNYRVVEKRKVSIPDELIGIVRCENPNCISNMEPVEARAIVVSKNPPRIKCYYCGRYINDIENQVI